MLLKETYRFRPFKKPKADYCQLCTEDATYNCIAVYTFPISNPDKLNHNNRIYPTTLWEKIIAQGDGVGSFGLCDNPVNGGKVKDTFCVWQNLRFTPNKTLVMADAYLFGKWGKLCHEAIQAGAEIGLQLQGEGTLARDGKTVTTYNIDRIADWIIPTETPTNQPLLTSEQSKKQLPKVQEGFYRNHPLWV
jgi:hypothetical protein